MEHSSTESTAVLIERLRAGDGAARERLLARFLPVLRRWAHGRLPPPARGMVDTDDLVQVTLISALDRIDLFEARHEGAFLGYLRQILLNALRDEIRRSRRRPGEGVPGDAVPDPGPSVVEQAIGSEMMARYEAALVQLPERQREAVLLRIEFGYSFREVADAVGVGSADGARMMVSRGLARIAEVLDG